MKIKETCDCGAQAQYVYMPGYSDNDNSFSCYNCVSKGCDCNYRPISWLTTEDGVEGVDWHFIDDSKTRYCSIDENGEEYPCSEYSWEENGFYTEEYENYLKSECEKLGYDILKNNPDPDFNEIIWTDKLISIIETMLIENNVQLPTNS